MPTKPLCIGIARCTNLGVHPCDKITSVQSNCILKQIPEPWNGHLSEAKILYIGSNPSIDCDEVYPDSTWSDKKICDFFENRFKKGKVKKTTGKEVAVPFWTYLINYTNWINEELKTSGKAFLTKYPITKQKKNMYDELNNDVVSTEIVHCKSKDAYGFEKACCKCGDMWMGNILNLFSGKLIVVLGKKAECAIKKCSKLNAIFGNLKVPVIYLPHPSRRMSVNNRKKAVQSELRKVGLI